MVAQTQYNQTANWIGWTKVQLKQNLGHRNCISREFISKLFSVETASSIFSLPYPLFRSNVSLSPEYILESNFVSQRRD